MDRPKISIIIPVKNGAKKLAQCLEAALAQSYKPEEVIVVDGHSIDGTVEVASRFPVKILYEDYHTRAGGCQVGINNARGEYVAFTDADCIPHRDWLANLVKEFNDGIAGVGGRVEDIGEGLWIRSINLTLGTLLSGSRSRWRNKRIIKKLGIGGSNGMCRVADIQKAGGFDVNLTGAEDLEVGSRIGRLGKLLYTPDALVLHDHSRGMKGFAQEAYRYGGWRRESRVWGGQAVPPIVVPLVILSLILTRWVFLGAIILYLATALIMGIKFAFQERDPRFLFSIPVVYAMEHSLFIIGFWKEVLRPRRRKKR